MPRKDDTDVLTRQLTTRRVLNCYLMIKAQRYGMTIEDLMLKFELHRRTVYRYVAVLLDVKMIERKGDHYHATP